MRINVKLFAGARQRAGSDHLSVELPEPATVAQVRAALAQRCPELASWSRHLIVTVDRDYVPDDQVVSEGSEVACFPPVSGG